jgi:hypothetical protein
VRNVSENFKNIKKDTKKSIKGNFFLSKKEDEIKNITKEMMLYNNPSNKK